MFTYDTPPSPPKIEEIRIFKVHEAPYSPDACGWEDWIQTQGTILMKVICADGLFFIVRDK